MLKMSVNKRNKSNKTSSSETFSSNVKIENIEKIQMSVFSEKSRVFSINHETSEYKRSGMI